MNEWIVLMKILKEIGLAAGAFALCAWIVVYIVKRVAVNLDRLTIRIEQGIAKQDVFMAREKKEHEDLKDDHKEFALQNKEITAALGRINGYVK